MTRYQIQYISRRSLCRDVDIEDQKWLVAAGETVIGTEAQADEHAACLDADTDGAFIHRAVPMASEPEDQLSLTQPVKIPAVAAARRAS
jgi:hypothetical protein